MSLPGQHTPVLRYFSPARMALVALTSDGLTLIRRIEDEDWKIAARKKQSPTFEEWLAIKKRNIAALPAWAVEVKELPSLEQLQDWLTDGICETPTGDQVEPDGQGPDGAPSWLRLLGFI